MRGRVLGVDGGFLTVELDGGALIRSRHGEGLEAGDQVVVVVRQEHLQLGSGDESGLNRVSGKAHQSVFLGGLSSVDVMIAGEQRLTAKSLKFAQPVPENGAATHLVWDSTNTLVYAPNGPDAA
ncbi:MAG: TOBE domain-containing protein [Rhizobiaceae bacterium]